MRKTINSSLFGMDLCFLFENVGPSPSPSSVYYRHLKKQSNNVCTDYTFEGLTAIILSVKIFFSEKLLIIYINCSVEVSPLRLETSWD